VALSLVDPTTLLTPFFPRAGSTPAYLLPFSPRSVPFLPWHQPQIFPPPVGLGESHFPQQQFAFLVTSPFILGAFGQTPSPKRGFPCRSHPSVPFFSPSKPPLLTVFHASLGGTSFSGVPSFLTTTLTGALRPTPHIFSVSPLPSFFCPFCRFLLRRLFNPFRAPPPSSGIELWVTP